MFGSPCRSTNHAPARRRQPTYDRQGGLRACQCSAQELRATTAQHGPQDQRHQDRVIELAGNRDEVRHEVDRRGQVADQDNDRCLSPTLDPRVGEQPPEFLTNLVLVFAGDVLGSLFAGFALVASAGVQGAGAGLVVVLDVFRLGVDASRLTGRRLRRGIVRATRGVQQVGRSPAARPPSAYDAINQGG